MRVCLCVNAFVFVCLNVSVCVCVNVRGYAYANVWIRQSVNVQIRLCASILMCSTKLSTALSLSKFNRFFGQKRSGITPFFETSKHHFQPRFYLSVSPDCKMCVRVTNTGESPVFWCYKSRSRSINETWQSLMTITIICFTIIVLLYLGIITENNYICPAIHLLHK